MKYVLSFFLATNFLMFPLHLMNPSWVGFSANVLSSVFSFVWLRSLFRE